MKPLASFLGTRRCLATAALSCAAALPVLSQPAPAAAIAPAAGVPAESGGLAVVAAELRKAIDVKLAAIGAGDEVPNRFDWTALDGQFDELVQELPTLPAQEARNRLRNLSANVKSEEARALLARLGAALEVELKNAALAEEKALGDKLVEIARSALAAGSPEEIDVLYDRMEELQQQINEFRGPRQSRFHNLHNRQQNFLTAWQNLLEAVADGSRQGVRNAESNLLGGYSRAFGVGRSEVRARVRELVASLPGSGASAELLRGLSLDRLGEVQRELLSENESMGWNTDANIRMQIVASIDHVRLATSSAQAGEMDLALSQLAGGGEGFPGGSVAENYVVLQRLRSAWLGRELPRLTGLKNLPPPAAEEFPETYLRRLALAADAAGELEQAGVLAKALGVYTARLGVNGGRRVGDDLVAAYEHFRAGRGLESVGEKEEAARFYRQAITAGAPAGLLSELATRLRAISEPDV
jgi:hypothetical protein